MCNKLLLTLPILLFLGCSDDNTPIIPEATEVEITMKAGVGSIESTTRGSGVINATLTSHLPVSFVRKDGAGSWAGTPLAAEINKDDNNIIFGTVATPVPQYYKTNGETTYVFGYHPQAGTWNGTDVSFTIDGTTDIMTTAETNLGNKDNPETPNIIFNHQLTQIQVFAYTTDATGRTRWGNVQAISIADRETKATFNPTNGFVANQSTGMADMPIWKWASTTEALTGYELPVTAEPDLDTDAPSGYALIAETSDQLTLKVKTVTSDNLTVTVPSPDASSTWEKGKVYKITLNFSSAGISPKVTIADWEYEDIGDIPIH